MKKKFEKLVIGRSDKIDFPDLSLFDIDAKIDTGAYSCSIHCHSIEVVDEGKLKMVHFHLLDPSHPEYNEKQFILPVFSMRNVKSSSGNIERRVFIQTTALLFDQLFKIDLSLTDRSDMSFPVLLGRKLLMSRFVVDVHKSNLSYNMKQKLL